MGYPATVLRCIIVLVILAPLVFRYHKQEPLNLRANWGALLLLTLSSVLIWGPLYYAVLHAGVGVSLAVNYAAIVMGMFLYGRLLFAEKFTLGKLTSLGLSLIGLGLIFIPGHANFGLLALGAATMSGFASSFNLILSRKLTYNPTQSTVMLWATGLLANSVMMFVVSERFPSLTWGTHWIYLLMFGVASVAASWTFVSGLRRIDAGVAGVLGLLEVIFGMLFGVLLFNEQPGIWAFAGAAVIMLAAAVPYLSTLHARSQLAS
jgi:drug/metabolite transporter (DMT)-like permease